jgi:NAD(P)-dependent dehydrogenase (short-subunit alcohol dehydrogenase family)
MTDPARPDGPAVDSRHLLVIGAGPGLGGAIAHRFAQGGYRLTLLARRTDGGYYGARAGERLVQGSWPYTGTPGTIQQTAECTRR